jgi:hypothetical protein
MVLVLVWPGWFGAWGLVVWRIPMDSVRYPSELMKEEMFIPHNREQLVVAPSWSRTPNPGQRFHRPGGTGVCQSGPHAPLHDAACLLVSYCVRCRPYRASLSICGIP